MKASALFHFSLFLFTSLSAVASPAMTNLVDSTAAWAAFADYTNNVLRVEQVEPAEKLPFNMPFQLVIGPKAEDKLAAEAALETVRTSMPTHVRVYFEQHKLMAPLYQWLVRRCKPGVTNEDTYLSAAAHPSVWQAKDFDLRQLADAARNLASNSIPMMAVLRPIYEEYELNPIQRAEPLVDYSDPRPEETYATPFGIATVLRAPERRRKFRVFATGWPLSGRDVNYKWVSIPRGVWASAVQNRWGDGYRPENGFADLTLDWNGALRRDVLVFARYGDGPWGPPSVISFCRIPNEKRQYDKDGRPLSVEYLADKAVIPQLYQNKPWKDLYEYDSLGRALGFSRTRTGQFREERFSSPSEFVVETYPGDLPKLTNKVRYFTSPSDPATLDYEITDEEIRHSSRPVASRNRGEFPSVKPEPRKR